MPTPPKQEEKMAPAAPHPEPPKGPPPGQAVPAKEPPAPTPLKIPDHGRPYEPQPRPIHPKDPGY